MSGSCTRRGLVTSKDQDVLAQLPRGIRERVVHSQTSCALLNGMLSSVNFCGLVVQKDGKTLSSYAVGWQRVN